MGGRVYQILTKWVFLLTLPPIFAVMFLFPKATISFLFGEKYVSAAPALQILSLGGFMFHTFLGLNGMTLIVIGKPKLNMVGGDTFAVVSNISLNLALIPPRYGMVGAAVATAVSYFVANVFRSYWLYKMTGIHPFSWNYVKPLGISFLLLGVLKWLNLDVEDIWHAIPVLVVFLAVYALLVLLSRSIDREDVELLLTVEKRLGINLGGRIKKILRKFV
ncbi:MATE family efflux transporter [Thermococcus peptonophilus]|uniref:polysaccharide biosynthesis C-terminal domain-containing protein n=1 Tax=Thermococcus peptonophilus TaxID=53952 RepID=UPI000AD1B8B8